MRRVDEMARAAECFEAVVNSALENARASRLEVPFAAAYWRALRRLERVGAALPEASSPELSWVR